MDRYRIEDLFYDKILKSYRSIRRVKFFTPYGRCPGKTIRIEKLFEHFRE